MKCPNCGNEYHWNSDFMLSEIEGYDYDEIDPDDDRVVNCCTCNECGAEIEIIHLSNNQLNDFKPKSDEEGGECFNCNGEVEFVEETTRSKEEEFDFGEDDDQKIKKYKCQRCGADIILTFPSKNMLEEE